MYLKSFNLSYRYTAACKVTLCAIFFLIFYSILIAYHLPIMPWPSRLSAEVIYRNMKNSSPQGPPPTDLIPLFSWVVVPCTLGGSWPPGSYVVATLDPLELLWEKNRGLVGGLLGSILGGCSGKRRRRNWIFHFPRIRLNSSHYWNKWLT